MKNAEYKETEIGKIPGEWGIKRIGDLVSINENTINRNYPHEDIEYIDIASVREGRIVDAQRISLQESPSRAKRIVKDKDILISTVRPNLRHYVFIDKARNNTVASTGFAVISSKKIIPRFLYYFLTMEKYTNFLTAIADTHTSTYPSFNPDIIGDSYIAFPSLEEQSAIAKILSDLDAKIELNQQMNRTLEAIGQALFKHWFVDFEFPDAYGRPGKCEELPLSMLVTFVKGRKPPQTYLDNIAGTLPQILIEVLDGAEPSFAYPENMIICGQNDVLMVMDGASSGRTEIGFSGIIGSTLAKIICQTGKITAAYLYFYLKNRQKEIAENTTGSAIPHADRKRIEAMIAALPNQPILEAFTSIATKLFQQIRENKKQIKILSQIRDSLLPRLMSGRIRVI